MYFHDRDQKPDNIITYSCDFQMVNEVYYMTAWIGDIHR